jgi:hypothetical protein
MYINTYGFFLYIIKCNFCYIEIANLNIYPACLDKENVSCIDITLAWVIIDDLHF